MLLYRNKIIYFIITISFSLLASCATQQEVDILQWTVQDMKRDLREMESKTEKMQGGGKEDLNRIKGEQESFKSGQREVHKKLQSLAKEMQVLTDRIDKIELALNQSGLQDSIVSREQLLNEISRLNERINDLTRKMGGTPERSNYISSPEFPSHSTRRTPSATDIPVTKTKPEKSTAESLYDDALQAYKDGQTRKAREIFNQIVRDHPKSEYSENAQYWIGETYYKEKDYELAFMAFQEVLRKNPQSAKAPAALYKQALSFYKIGDQKAGEYYLKRLIENYPTSQEAIKAKAKLGQ